MRRCASTSTRSTTSEPIVVACRSLPTEEVIRVPEKTLTIHLPKRYQDEQVLERLRKIAEHDDRSLNHVAVQAILEYLDRRETR